MMKCPFCRKNEVQEAPFPMCEDCAELWGKFQSANEMYRSLLLTARSSRLDELRARIQNTETKTGEALMEIIKSVEEIQLATDNIKKVISNILEDEK